MSDPDPIHYRPPPLNAPTAVVRPRETSPSAGPGSQRSRTGREIVSAAVLALLVIVAGVTVGLLLAGGHWSDDPPVGMRLASPEEAAAVGEPAMAQPTDQPPEFEAPAEPAIATPRSPADQDSQPVATGKPAEAPEPEPPPAAAAVADEPVVAVAETVIPSVVRIEVESDFGTGLGSGIVWDADSGYIVTNQHVVEGADWVSVSFSDGVSVEGEVVGGSTDHDVAVVKVDPDTPQLVPAVFAPTSSVRVGQLAVAIGSPLGLTGTVTAGIVSAVRIQLAPGELGMGSGVPVEMIQTDAAINQGNSGGALADSQGRVVGMNTLIQTTSGGNIGLGFAVPADTVVLIATRIIKGQSLELGYLGISSDPGDEGDLGVTIAEVVANSPAEDAGLMAGDVIVSLDGEPMYDISELSAAVKLRSPGEVVELTVRREADLYVATVVLGTLP